MTLTAGDRLGRYEIICAIGAGGMGHVFRAHDVGLGRDVAVKVIRDDVAADPDRVRRLDQEARAIAALNHPHICQIYDVVQRPPDAATGAAAIFLVLELVDGAPIQGELPPQEAVRLGIQIASAIDAAHEKGILHPTGTKQNASSGSRWSRNQPRYSCTDITLTTACCHSAGRAKRSTITRSCSPKTP